MEELEKNPDGNSIKDNHKKRHRKTLEEKLSEAKKKKKRADDISKKHNDEILRIKEEIQNAAWKELLREAKAAGADENIVISIIMKQKDMIIDKAVKLTKENDKK